MLRLDRAAKLLTCLLELLLVVLLRIRRDGVHGVRGRSLVRNGAFASVENSRLIFNLDVDWVCHALSAHLAADNAWALRICAVTGFSAGRTLELLRAWSEAHGTAACGRTRAAVHGVVHHAALVQLLLASHVELVLYATR